jgi:hypothetical protein
MSAALPEGKPFPQRLKRHYAMFKAPQQKLRKRK